LIAWIEFIQGTGPSQLDIITRRCQHLGNFFVGAVLSNVQEFMSSGRELISEKLLPQIAKQASQADRTRSLDPSVIQAIKQTDLIRLSATRNLGGVEAGMGTVARELEAIAGCCGSTAWCLWNHLCVFHFFCGELGPEGIDTLRGIVEGREWVSFPAGAGTNVRGRAQGDHVILNGRASFGSGARYGDWVGCWFAMEAKDKTPEDKPDLHFTVVRTDDPGVSVDPTWFAMSLRASATDHVNFKEVSVPARRVRIFHSGFRRQFRDPATPVIAPRYREDWVALSVLWLGAQGVGVANAALEEACAGLAERIAIFGVKVAEKSTVQVNLGQAAAAIAAARAAVEKGCAETDARIEASITPTEADYLRQLSYGMGSLRLCDEAMRLILRVLGGNGLREGASFERRYRDFQAMPLHINAHPDRVGELVGRFLLGMSADW